MNSLFLNLGIAWRNLLQHRRRSLFLGGALALVTASFLLLQGLSEGIRRTMMESATTLMTGHVNVGGFFKVTSGQSGPIVTDYQKVMDFVKKEVPELAFVTHRGRGWAKGVSDTGSTQLGLGGVDVDQEPGLRRALRIKSGSLDGLREPGTILLFEEQEKKLGVKVGDMITLSAPTPKGVNNTLDVRVVAIAKNMGMMSSWNVFIPNRTLRELYQMNDKATGFIMLILKDPETIPQVESRLRKNLAEAGYRVMDYDPHVFWMKFEKVNREAWTGQKLDVTNWKDEVDFLLWIVTAFQGLSYFITIILIVIVVVGIMNTLWIAIRERTREIGTLRAIGMSRFQVGLSFLMESVFLGMAGSLAGCALGWSLAFLITHLGLRVPEFAQMFLMSETLSVYIVPLTALQALVAIPLVTGLAAVVPSVRAAYLSPVNAMRHAG